MENVQRMAGILNLLRQADPHIPVSPELLAELERLPQRNQRFDQLLNDITLLTHQLEQRYRGILPFSIDTTSLQRLATRMHLRRDPARILWQHNDRYEQKMLALRQQRRGMLEYYFSAEQAAAQAIACLDPGHPGQPHVRAIAARGGGLPGHPAAHRHHPAHPPGHGDGARPVRHRYHRLQHV